MLLAIASINRLAIRLARKHLSRDTTFLGFIGTHLSISASKQLCSVRPAKGFECVSAAAGGSQQLGLSALRNAVRSETLGSFRGLKDMQAPGRLWDCRNQCSEGRRAIRKILYG